MNITVTSDFLSSVKQFTLVSVRTAAMMMTPVIRLLVKVTENHQIFAQNMGSDPAMQVTAVKMNGCQETYKLETNTSLITRCIILV